MRNPTWFRSMLHDAWWSSREESPHSMDIEVLRNRGALSTIRASSFIRRSTWPQILLVRRGMFPLYWNVPLRDLGTRVYTDETPTNFGASREAGASLLHVRFQLFAAALSCEYTNILQRSVLQAYDLVLANAGT